MVHLGRKSAHQDSGFWRKSPPPTPYPCSNSNAEVNNHSYCNGTMGGGPEGFGAPVSVAPAAILWQKRKAVSGASERARASRPDTTRRPSQRSPTRLQPATPQPTHHASTPGPWRLPCALVPAVDPLLHPLPVAGIARAPLHRPATTQISATQILPCQG